MTLNDLRDWHNAKILWHGGNTHREKTLRAFHEEAVTCLDHAIRDWDRNAEREERNAKAHPRFNPSRRNVIDD